MGKLSSKSDRDKIDKKSDERDWIDIIDDKKFDERDHIGEKKENEIYPEK